MKGQLARRTSMKASFEGGQLPIHRRVPKRGFINIHRVEYYGLNVEVLEGNFDKGADVTMELLREKGLIPKKTTHIKLLGNGELKTSLKVHVHRASKSAIEKIEGASGTIEYVSTKPVKADSAATA